jgi:hypothetical protein
LGNATIEIDQRIVSRAILLIRKIPWQQFRRTLSEQDSPRCAPPVFGVDGRRLDPAVADVLDEVQHVVNAALLPGWSVLIHENMDDCGGMNVRHEIFLPARPRRFEDCECAMLLITGVPSPPNNAEELAWMKLMNGATALRVRTGRCPEAQGVNPHMRNRRGGEMS